MTRPLSPNGNRLRKLQFPDQVIPRKAKSPKFARLGGVEDALDFQSLREKGIGAILNLALSGCLYSLACRSEAFDFTAAGYEEMRALPADQRYTF